MFQNLMLLGEEILYLPSKQTGTLYLPSKNTDEDIVLYTLFR